LIAQERESPRDYVERESHYVWGKRYLLHLQHTAAKPAVDLQHRTMVVQLPPSASREERQAVLNAWYRDELKKAARPLIEKWQGKLGVQVSRLYVQRMKTKWGSCNTSARNI